MIKRFLDALAAARLDLNTEEVADALWLASYMRLAATPTVVPSSSDTEKPPESPGPAKSDEAEEGSKVLAEGASPAELHLPASSGTAARCQGRRGRTIQSPGVPALPGALEIARSLRPFKRRIPSRRRYLLDEEATVTQIAEGGPKVPVLKSAPERWLELALVVDKSPTMVLWRQTVVELLHLLECHGSFRDVRLWSLTTDSGKIRLQTGLSIGARPGNRSPRELVDSSGQRLVMVVSDCVSEAWHRGEMTAQALSIWARSGPMVLLQVLPERLWPRTGLARASDVHLAGSLPGLPSHRLRVRNRRDQWRPVNPGEVALPVITLEPRSLSAWAGMVAGIGGGWVPGKLLELAAEADVAVADAAPESEAGDLPTAAQRIRRFRASSPMARKLAGYLAAAPLSLPVMRLVQAVMLPDSRQVHLAEVFLGGLLKQVSSDTDVSPEEVQYEFEDGVRDLLLNDVRRSETLQVLEKVSAWLERQQEVKRGFRALIEDPSSDKEIAVNEGSRPFASVTAGVLRRLGLRQYQQAAVDIEQAIAARPLKEAGARRTAPPRRAAAETVDIFELTIEIERRGGAIQARSHLRGGAVFERDPLSWREVQADWDLLRQRLDEAGKRALTAWLKEVPLGEDTFLFRLLFGEERQWGPVFRALYGTDSRAPQPTPVMHPVRLRVVTADPDLAGFPWRLVALDGRLLVNHGWTFEVAREVVPSRSVFVPAPASLVVFSPGGSGLFAEIAATCSEIWPRTDLDNLLLEVKTVPRLEYGLAGLRPHVLVLEGLGGALPPAELPALFRRAGHTPDAVVVCGTGAPVPPALLSSDVAFLAWPRLAGAGEHDRGWLVPWLRRWLERGEDPLLAFYAVAREKDLRESLTASTLAVCTAYRSWSTDLPSRATGRWDPRNELDRFEVKAEVGRRLTHLVRQDGRRSMALVASAEPGHSLVSLSGQLRGDLERETDPTRQPIKWHKIDFPENRNPGRLPGLLGEAVHLYLGADDGERLPHLLRRRGPHGVPPGTRGVLWLDWGTFGETEGCRRRLKPEELRAWVRFSGEMLARECPPDLRVVSYLAIETEKLVALYDLLHKLQDEPVSLSPEFSLIPLPALQPVSAHDLREFLREPRYGCPANLQGEIARRVYDQAKGRFDPTVELLEKAKQTSWYTLLDLLRREQGVAAPDPEEEL